MRQEAGHPSHHLHCCNLACLTCSVPAVLPTSKECVSDAALVCAAGVRAALLPQDKLLAFSSVITSRRNIAAIICQCAAMRKLFLACLPSASDVSSKSTLLYWHWISWRQWKQRGDVTHPSSQPGSHEHCKVAEDFEILHGVSFAAN